PSTEFALAGRGETVVASRAACPAAGGAERQAPTIQFVSQYTMGDVTTVDHSAASCRARRPSEISLREIADDIGNHHGYDRLIMEKGIPGGCDGLEHASPLFTKSDSHDPCAPTFASANRHQYPEHA